VLRLRDSVNPGGFIVVEQASDITDRVALEKQSALLVRELDHRVRNILTVVQALARMSIPDAPLEQKRKLEYRIAALAEANKLLHEASWKHADLRSIIDETADSLGFADRLAAEGPDVAIVADHAFGLSLALHELATNALKYGALSDPVGRVKISWTVGEDDEAVLLRWKEHDGPPVKQPSRAGFGSRLIRGAIAGAAATISYEPDGLACELNLKRVAGGEGTGRGLSGR
jgi:two-component sensor histidine kinase